MISKRSLAALQVGRAKPRLMLKLTFSIYNTEVASGSSLFY